MERSDARVFVRSEINVLASPRRVWTVLADIDAWPAWNPGVRSAHLRGDLETATHFDWAAGPSTNSGVLDRVDAPRMLAWHASSMGIRHLQEWSIEPLPSGCRVTAEQALYGAIARLLSARLQQSTQGGLDTWVRLLKLEAETRPADDELPEEEPTQVGTVREGAP